jgi:hypothetical protein
VVALIPVIIPDRIFDTAVGGRPTTIDRPLKDTNTIHQGRLLLPQLSIDTNPTELLQTVSHAKDTETRRADGVVAIPIEDMGILLTHSNLFEKVWLQDVWKNLLTALTCPPTAGNLQFLEGEDYEMDFGEDYGKEAGVNTGLPPNK